MAPTIRRANSSGASPGWRGTSTRRVSIAVEPGPAAAASRQAEPVHPPGVASVPRARALVKAGGAQPQPVDREPAAVIAVPTDGAARLGPGAA